MNYLIQFQIILKPEKFEWNKNQCYGLQMKPFHEIKVILIDIRYQRCQMLEPNLILWLDQGEWIKGRTNWIYVCYKTDYSNTEPCRFYTEIYTGCFCWIEWIILFHIECYPYLKIITIKDVEGWIWLSESGEGSKRKAYEDAHYCVETNMSF